MADEQICIHTPQGMLCYENGNSPPVTQYHLSIYLLDSGTTTLLNGGAWFRPPQPLATSADKVAELLRVAYGGPTDPPIRDPNWPRLLRDLHVEEWCCITRKVRHPS
jgi:hypothetical protein